MFSVWADKMKTFRFVMVGLVCAAGILAQQTLDNDAILKMLKAGVSSNIILSIVKSQPGNYSVGVNDIIRLTKAGVPDAVVSAMIDSPQAAASHTSWKDAPVAQWGEEEAKQFLTDSPWVKSVLPNPVRNLSPFERRDSGDWNADIGTGYGLAATGFFGDWREIQALELAHERASLNMVSVRWESALPVQAAESKAGESGVPGWMGDYYAIAIHGVPRLYPRSLANHLKGLAALRRNGQKDIKPLKVVILPDTDDLETLVYLFPRSVKIAKEDGSVGFTAQIGRLVVFVNFFPEDMQIQGALQL